MMGLMGGALGGSYFLLFVTYVVLALIVRIAFASAIYNDAQVRPARFVKPRIWGLATLLGGVLTVGVYWLIHFSTLAPPPPSSDA